MSISEPPTRIGPESAGILMTPEEFDGNTDYDDLYCYELVHGVLVVNPIPSEAEGGPNEELGYLLRDYQRRHPQGSALDDTLQERYLRTADSRRRADRVIWAGLGRRPRPKEDVPTMVVEFVSVGKVNRRRDYEEKRKEYLEISVAEYWIIDRFHRQVTVYRREPGKRAMQVVREDETYRTKLLPGFELPLAQLLAVADKWAQA
ncbi:MAG: Uma2 family endonuclease [Planctomycetes bacterium]|nr:Uma2 family endonuclease [Planctomycetota bacterium]